MCVVALMLASPVICTATTISEALATAGDEKYLELAAGSSITLDFGTACGSGYPSIVLNFACTSTGIKIEFYDDSKNLVASGYTAELAFEESSEFAAGVNVEVDWGDVTFYSVTITASGSALYLDAVWGVSGTVYVPPLPDTPVDMIGTLSKKITAINSMQGIPNGILGSLEAKLQNAINAINDLNANDVASAIGKLQAFINEVNAQRGNKITGDQADVLIGGRDSSSDPLPELGFFVGAQDIVDLLTSM